MASKIAYSAGLVPTTEHWVVLANKSYTIPGDERSRSSPGHGYPESTEHYMEYTVYFSENDMMAAMQRANVIQGSMVGIHVVGTYTAEVTIRVVKETR